MNEMRGVGFINPSNIMTRIRVKENEKKGKGADMILVNFPPVIIKYMID